MIYKLREAIDVTDEYRITGLLVTQYGSDDATAVLAVYNGQDRIPLSVNIPGKSEALAEGQFAAKNWSEGKRQYEKLVEAGVLVPTGQGLPTGHVVAPIVAINQDKVFGMSAEAETTV